MADRTTPRPPVRAALIGCGNIGSRFDECSGRRGLTHASALAANGVHLVAVCDVDRGRATACAEARGVESSGVFDDYVLMLQREPIDLLCIATPTGMGRFDIVRRAVDMGVRAIFCEKPVEATLRDAELLRELVPADMVFAVNYLRSWSPGLAIARRWTENWPNIERVVVHYDKGFANNGSHAVDLLRHFVGWPQQIVATHVQPDGFVDDPTVDALISFADGARGHFIASDYRDYSRFEAELSSAAGRVVFLDKGRTVVLETPDADADYPNYRVLAPRERLDGALDGAMIRAVASVIDALHGDRSGVHCTLDDAVATMRAVEAVGNSLANMEST